MLLLDVNILVYAYRDAAPGHDRYRDWLNDLVNGPEAFAVCDLVLSGFLRIVTHPAIFSPPAPVEDALRFAEAIRSRPNYVPINPGSRHWEIFAGLCTSTRASGNLVLDAYLAALTIESGSDWISTDRDYARFPGLRCRRPF